MLTVPKERGDLLVFGSLIDTPLLSYRIFCAPFGAKMAEEAHG
jgi:hypothetical protein